MYPTASQPGRNTANISVHKIENGFQVNYNKEDKKLSADGNNFLYDYINETYGFSTAEEAVAKVTELLARE